jgi:hypothetical protein
VIDLQDGRWYSIGRPVPGAHCTPDGRAIGIFQRGERPLEPCFNDKGEITFRRGQKLPPRIAVQAPDGHDLIEYDLSNPHQPKCRRVVFALEHCGDVQPVIEADHLPESRKAHLPPGLRLVEDELAEQPGLLTTPA